MTIEKKIEEKRAEPNEREMDELILEGLAATGVDMAKVTPEMIQQAKESIERFPKSNAPSPSSPGQEDPKAARSAFIREAISQLMPMVGIIQAQLATLATQEQIKTVNGNIGTVIKRLNAIEAKFK